MNKQTPLLILFCLALAACTAIKSEPVSRSTPPQSDGTGPVVLTAEQVKTIQMSTIAVSQKILPVTVSTPGQVEADANKTTPVLSPVAGRVEDVVVHLGDIVKAGQIVASVRSDDVAQIESDLLKSVLDVEADREQYKVELELDVANYNRKKTLVDQGVAAKADLEAAVHDLAKAKAELGSLDQKQAAAITTAEQRLRFYGVVPSEVNRVLGQKTIDNRFDIRAPRTGVITSRDVNPGQLVDTTKSLIVISDLSTVWLVAHVFENNIGKIKIGQSVAVAVDSYPGSSFRGTIDYLASSIDPATRTLAVRATVQNDQEKLKPQMFARMSICTGSTNVLAVPKAAVQRTGEMDIAYVPLSGNRFEERKIELGQVVGSYVTVKSGLKRGEDVVVNGSLELNGQAIQQRESER